MKNVLGLVTVVCTLVAATVYGQGDGCNGSRGWQRRRRSTAASTSAA